MQVIAAQGEQRASHALKEASEVMSESPAALQLRYLQVGATGAYIWVFNNYLLFQTLGGISAEKNSTVIFPIPIDMLKKYLQ